ncbi:MAG: hypothetical protein ABH950_01120 [Candidatus Altiarchaeota archaeon]
MHLREVFYPTKGKIILFLLMVFLDLVLYLLPLFGLIPVYLNPNEDLIAMIYFFAFIMPVYYATFILQMILPEWGFIIGTLLILPYQYLIVCTFSMLFDAFSESRRMNEKIEKTS